MSHNYRTRHQATDAPLGIISWPISRDLFSVEEFQVILELQTSFTTSIIRSEYAGLYLHQILCKTTRKEAVSLCGC